MEIGNGGPLLHGGGMEQSQAPIPLQNLLREAASRLPREDAEPLLLHVLGQDRAWLFAHATDPVPPAKAAAYRALVPRRAQGEPVAHLAGRRGFWALDLGLAPDAPLPP